MVLLCLSKVKNWEGAASSLAHTVLKPSQVTRNEKLD